jgi:hypothetical protein
MHVKAYYIDVMFIVTYDKAYFIIVHLLMNYKNVNISFLLGCGKYSSLMVVISAH